jgi:hypothetical protein
MGRIVLHVRALLLVAAARVLLRRHDTTWTLRRLARRDVMPVVPADALIAVQRAGRLARAACLAQSVALTALLERGGAAPVLVLGCRRYEDRRWGAHAWVVLEGTVWEPVPAGAHEELAQLSAADAWIPTSRGRGSGEAR